MKNILLITFFIIVILLIGYTLFDLTKMADELQTKIRQKSAEITLFTIFAVAIYKVITGMLLGKNIETNYLTIIVFISSIYLLFSRIYLLYLTKK